MTLASILLGQHGIDGGARNASCPGDGGYLTTLSALFVKSEDHLDLFVTDLDASATY